MLAYILIAIGLAFLLLFLFKRNSDSPPPPQPQAKTAEAPKAAEPQEPLGRVRIYYGTKTGTAAKLSQQLAEQGAEQGFAPQVIDLKDAQTRHFAVHVSRLRQ